MMGYDALFLFLEVKQYQKQSWPLYSITGLISVYYGHERGLMEYEMDDEDELLVIDGEWGE
jgi:hypothetical protein